MEDYILKVKDLSLKLDQEKIFNHLSFQVKVGEFLTILGPNGSGKTVLLRTLLGLIPKYQGEIIWRKDAKIGYLPQGLTHLKVKDLPLSVKEFLALKKMKEEKMLEFLDLVGIKDTNILNKNFGSLSGGQFQRILMIWALANDPNVLLFDEPTTGVDVNGEKSVYDLLLKFQKERNLTIILITHDFNVVSRYSSDVLCLSKDNVCHARPQEVLSSQNLEKIYGTPIKFYQHHH